MSRTCWASTAIAILILSLLLPVAVAATTSSGNAILGTWEVEDGSGKIEIQSCGNKYCGRIVWLRESNYPSGDSGGMGGKPLVDRENPDPGLRNRQQLGLRIMEGYTFNGKDFWENGRIYNTENGKTYSSDLTLLSQDRLRLRGYIGIPLIGGSTVWKRVAKGR